MDSRLRGNDGAVSAGINKLPLALRIAAFRQAIRSLSLATAKNLLIGYRRKASRWHAVFTIHCHYVTAFSRCGAIMEDYGVWDDALCPSDVA